jgi:hypothetical protein
MEGKDEGRSTDETEITLDMISAGVVAYDAFDPEREDPEALVFSILYRALRVVKNN